MPIAIGGILHESNTFAASTTPLAAFTVRRAEEIVAAHADTDHEVAGFLQGAAECRLEIVPTLLAGATPAGTVAAEAFETLVGELVTRLDEARPLDGVLLALHGAMAVDGFPDGDGEVVRRVREALGPELPIVATHDFHANISDRLVALTTALVVYQTNPHVDQRERGVQAAHLLVRILRGEARPTQAIARPAMLWNILHQNTSAEPLRSIMAEARTIEREPGVLAASVAGGYQYADVWEVGPSAVVVTDNDRAKATALAERLAARLWEARARLIVDLPSPEEAIRQADLTPRPPSLQGKGELEEGGLPVRPGADLTSLPPSLQGKGVQEEQSLSLRPGTQNMAPPSLAGKGAGGLGPAPVILVDMGDNIGGGSAGDSTFLLAELLQQGAHGWVMTLADPGAVAECVRAGVGQRVSLTVGGTTDTLHGAPVPVNGRVRCLHEGTYEDPERRHGGQRRYDQGLTAVVAVGRQPPAVGDEPTADSRQPIASYLVLTSRRHPPFSLQQLVSLGISPERQRILVVKAAIAYRAAYEPIAGRIIEVNTPGLTCIDPAAFTYTRARRPLWGLRRAEDVSR